MSTLEGLRDFTSASAAVRKRFEDDFPDVVAPGYLEAALGKGKKCLAPKERERLVEEGKRLAEKAMMIAEFTQKHKNPDAAFKALSGVESHGMQWVVKPYGIFFHGDDEALKTAKWRGMGGGATRHDGVLVPELSGLVGCGDLKSCEHELNHMFLQDNRTHTTFMRLRDMFPAESIALGKYMPEDVDTDFPLLVALYSNGLMKDELMTRVLSGESGELLALPPTHKRRVGSYIWNAGPYRILPIYAFYTQECGWFNDERLDALMADERERRGLPKDKPVLEEREKYRLMDKLRCYESPYRTNYAVTVGAIEMALWKGVEKEVVAAAMEETEFMRIPEKLNALSRG
ncbi:MAG: hypothetical protein KKD39_06140 [Candidatus Altiarchaeota archaeon]|nr:hypothetical protein [Candidatus Altiarchaeota archaeon]